METSRKTDPALIAERVRFFMASQFPRQRGETHFRARPFKVTPATLTPRPETEELVDVALVKLADLGRGSAVFSPLPQGERGENPHKILDLGTGAGVIAISLALEFPAAQVTACDLSPAALTVAEENATRLNARVRFLHSDWFSALADERFHLIVANPPYIPAADPHLAGDGLRHEPRLALTDEADGLTAIRAIITAAPHHLEPNGWLLFEHGYDQGESARRLLTAAGFTQVHTWRDLAGQERISGGMWAEQHISE
ncbi:release factor glutamine methyltransferase [Betaproteobacteria bacterium]|nr:release factor glutamine methyltransferase [Betaproteobacteria bacterium]